eukprot:135233_1
MSWKELNAGKADEIRQQIIRMEDSIWWSTDYYYKLVDDLLNNNKTEELKEATKINDKLRNENERFKSEAIQSNGTIDNLKRINKEALSEVDSLRTQNE